MAKYFNVEGIPDTLEFPDEFSDEEITEHMKGPEFGRWAAKTYGVLVQSEEDLDDWQITAGLKSGGISLKSGAVGSLAILAQKFDAPDIKDWAKEKLKNYNFQRKQVPGKNPTLASIKEDDDPEAGFFSSIAQDVDGFVNWALYNFGNAAPTTILPIIGGATMAAGGATANPLAVAAGWSMMYGYSAVMGAGEGFNEGMELELSDEQAANLGLAIAGPHAALEKIGAGGAVQSIIKKNFNIGKNIAKGVKTKGTLEGTKEVGEELARSPGLVRRMARGFGRTALAEGVTEGAQEALIAGGGQSMKGNSDFFRDPEFWKRIGEAGAAGAIGGGPFGAAFAIPRSKKQKLTDALLDVREDLDKEKKEGGTPTPEAPTTPEDMGGTPPPPGPVPPPTGPMPPAGPTTGGVPDTLYQDIQKDMEDEGYQFIDKEDFQELSDRWFEARKHFLPKEDIDVPFDMGPSRTIPEGTKVVDENGEPMRVYHGTRTQFDKFRPLSHFGDDAKAANDRLGYRDTLPGSPVREPRGRGAHIRTAYLDIRNPARVEDDKGALSSPTSYFEAARDAGHISEEEFLRETVENTPTNERFIEVMREKGFDGLVYKNRTEGAGDSFVIFDSAQVIEGIKPSETIPGQDPVVADNKASKVEEGNINQEVIEDEIINEEEKEKDAKTNHINGMAITRKIITAFNKWAALKTSVKRLKGVGDAELRAKVDRAWRDLRVTIKNQTGIVTRDEVDAYIYRLDEDYVDSTLGTIDYFKDALDIAPEISFVEMYVDQFKDDIETLISKTKYLKAQVDQLIEKGIVNRIKKGNLDFKARRFMQAQQTYLNHITALEQLDPIKAAKFSEVRNSQDAFVDLFEAPGNTFTPEEKKTARKEQQEKARKPLADITNLENKPSILEPFTAMQAANEKLIELEAIEQQVKADKRKTKTKYRVPEKVKTRRKELKAAIKEAGKDFETAMEAEGLTAAQWKQVVQNLNEKELPFDLSKIDSLEEQKEENLNPKPKTEPESEAIKEAEEKARAEAEAEEVKKADEAAAQEPIDYNEGLDDLDFANMTDEEIEAALGQAPQEDPYRIGNPEDALKPNAPYSKVEVALEKLNQILADMGMDWVKLEMPEHLIHMPSGNPLRGRYSRGLIEIALNNPDQLGTLRHEAIHALRDMGLFTDREWAVLRKAAKRWRRLYNIDPVYKKFNYTEEMLDEEAIAHAYEAWALAGVGVPPTRTLIRKVFDKIKNFLNTIAETFGIEGIHNVNDIFGRIHNGQIGVRARTQPRHTKLPSMLSAGFPGTRERIKNIRKFFGRSIVTNPDGSPRVVYHGTVDPEGWKRNGLSFRWTKDFGFHFGSHENANFATANKALQDYAEITAYERVAEMTGRSVEEVKRMVDSQQTITERNISTAYLAEQTRIIESMEGAHVMPMYIRLENPIILPDLETWDPVEIIDALTIGNTSVYNKIWNHIFGNMAQGDATHLYVNMAMEGVKQIWTPQEAANYKAILNQYETQEERQSVLRNIFKMMGHDGVFYKNLYEYSDTTSAPLELSDSYIVFDDNQVKSVHNWGTFNSNSNYMYSVQAPSRDPREHPSDLSKQGIKNLLSRALKEGKRLFESRSIKSADTMRWYTKFFASNRMIGAYYSKFAEMNSWLAKLKEHKNMLITDVSVLLRPFADAYNDPKKAARLTLANEIMMMNPGLYRPEGYVKEEYDKLSNDEKNAYWETTTLVFNNAHKDAVDGLGYDSQLKAGDIITLQGDEVRAYVQAQEAFSHVLNDLKKSLISISGEKINSAARKVNVPINDIHLGNLEISNEVLDEIMQRLDNQFDALAPQFAESIDELAILKLLMEIGANPGEGGSNISPFENLQGLYTTEVLPIDKEEAKNRYVRIDPKTKKAVLSELGRLIIIEVNEILKTTTDPREINLKLSNPSSTYWGPHEVRFKKAYYESLIQSKNLFKIYEDVRDGQTKEQKAQIKADFEALEIITREFKTIHKQLKKFEDYVEKDYMPHSRWGSQYIAIHKRDPSVPKGQRQDIKGKKPYAIKFIPFHFNTPTKTQKDMLVEDIVKVLKQQYPEDQYIIGGEYEGKITAKELSHEELRKGILGEGFNLDKTFSLLSSVDQETYGKAKEAMHNALVFKGVDALFSESLNIPGYELNFTQSAADYVQGLANYSAEIRFGHKAQKEVANMEGALQAHADKTLKYILDPKQEARIIRMAGFYFYLAANASSAIIQQFSNILITPADLAMLAGGQQHLPWVTKELAKATFDIGKMFEFGKARTYQDIFIDFHKGNLPKDETEALLRGVENGILKPYSLLEESGLSSEKGFFDVLLRSKGIGPAPSKVNAWNQTYMLGMFSTMEAAARMSAYLAAYRILKVKQSKNELESVVTLMNNNPQFVADTKIRALTSEDPNRAVSIEDIASFMIEDVFGVYGKRNRPKTHRGWIGAVAFQFQLYPWGIFELWGRLASMYGKEGQRALGVMMLFLFVFAGVRGLPGADDAEEWYRYLRRTFGDGINHDLSLTLRDTMYDIGFQNRRWADFIEKGAIYALSNADIQKRIGFGSLPGMDYLKILFGMHGDVHDMLGVPGTFLLGNVADATTLFANGRGSEALGIVLPLFMRNVIESVQWYQKGVRSKSGNQLVEAQDFSIYDALIKAAGFNPKVVSQGREQEFLEKNIGRAANATTQRYSNHLAELYFEFIMAQRENDKAGMRDANAAIKELFVDIREFNEGRPLFERVIIHQPSLKKKLRNRLYPKRSLSGIPKKAKRKVYETRQRYYNN